MDNSTPKYASWIPTAGGYVANGQVVSTTPQYDVSGNFMADIGNFTQPQTQQQTTQIAAQPTSGITTANATGSGTDANAAVTSIGANTSLDLNTSNPDESVLSTPVTKSPLTEEPILTPQDKAMKDIQDAAGRNDLQGMINGYIELSNVTGQDYTAEISRLTKQRQDKIKTMDDQYLQNINEAKIEANKTGDWTEYNKLVEDQANWRNTVGYQESMKSMYQEEIDELDTDFKNTWLKSANDICNQLIQALPGILNFQYNPYSDPALQIAQGYAVGRVKETMNSTGMYYSSMTQSAITKAVAELVPIYQKMAREEAIENFNLLQSTASFLMNLEQTQFEMWRAQIELKWAENDEKRKAYDQAIKNANARGYYTNEEAALLGVEPGTESYEARTRALDLQEQIDKEKRQLEQSKTLARFNSDLEVEEYEKKKKIDAKYTTNGNGGGGGGGTRSPYEGGTRTFYSFSGTLDASKLEEMYDNVSARTDDKNEAIAEVLPHAKNADQASLFLSSIGEKSSDWIANGKYTTSKLEGSGEKQVIDSNGNVITVSKNSITKAINDLRNDNGTFNESDIEDYFDGTIAEMNVADKVLAVEELGTQYLIPLIDSYASSFGKDYDKTKAALDNINTAISKFSDMAKEAGLSPDLIGYYIDYDNANDNQGIVKGVIANAYDEAFKKIKKAGDDFDFEWGDIFTDNSKSKDDARAYLADYMYKSTSDGVKRVASLYSDYRTKEKETKNTTSNRNINARRGKSYATKS